jgi:hypothetical protein
MIHTTTLSQECSSVILEVLAIGSLIILRTDTSFDATPSYYT